MIEEVALRNYVQLVLVLVLVQDTLVARHFDCMYDVKADPTDKERIKQEN